jgi:hypothetical protein
MLRNLSSIALLTLLSSLSDALALLRTSFFDISPYLLSPISCALDVPQTVSSQTLLFLLSPQSFALAVHDISAQRALISEQSRLTIAIGAATALVSFAQQPSQDRCHTLPSKECRPRVHTSPTRIAIRSLAHSESYGVAAHKRGVVLLDRDSRRIHSSAPSAVRRTHPSHGQ